MKKQMTAALLAGALSLVPAAGFAATQGAAPAPPRAAHASKPARATHAVRGVVRSIDDKSLVLTESGGKHAEETFALNASTQRTGSIAPGTAVSVRYREDGATHVATAIRVAPAGRKAASSRASRH